MASPQEVRFAFGKNWSDFLRLVDEPRVEAATASLRNMLGVDDLGGRTFLDVGGGSGLFSLAARRLGAVVHSFDYDPQSVACMQRLRERFCPGDDRWTIERGDVLDEAYVSSLGRHDVVYSWGVLHHTGNMERAVRNAAGRVGEDGLFFIALYNHQGLATSYWKVVKRAYCRAWRPVRGVMLGLYVPWVVARGLAKDLLTRRDPRDRYRRRERGMSVYHDCVDWLGGYPFEAATPEEVRALVEPLGFRYVAGTMRGRRSGCNEFVFRRTGTDASSPA